MTSDERRLFSVRDSIRQYEEHLKMLETWGLDWMSIYTQEQNALVSLRREEQRLVSEGVTL